MGVYLLYLPRLIQQLATTDMIFEVPCDAGCSEFHYKQKIMLHPNANPNGKQNGSWSSFKRAKVQKLCDIEVFRAVLYVKITNFDTSKNKP